MDHCSLTKARSASPLTAGSLGRYTTAGVLLCQAAGAARAAAVTLLRQQWVQPCMPTSSHNAPSLTPTGCRSGAHRVPEVTPGCPCGYAQELVSSHDHRGVCRAAGKARGKIHDLALWPDHSLTSGSSSASSTASPVSFLSVFCCVPLLVGDPFLQGFPSQAKSHYCTSRLRHTVDGKVYTIPACGQKKGLHVLLAHVEAQRLSMGLASFTGASARGSPQEVGRRPFSG